MRVHFHCWCILWVGGGGFLENICTGMLKVDFRMLTISIPMYCKKKKKKKTRSLYLTCITKPTHLYTIFTEMMTHYYHFHEQNSPLSYHHKNKGSLTYLEQFQNHPIRIPKLMKMHLKTFEHPRTPCFREYPPPPCIHSAAHTFTAWNVLSADTLYKSTYDLDFRYPH